MTALVSTLGVRPCVFPPAAPLRLFNQKTVFRVNSAAPGKLALTTESATLKRSNHLQRPRFHFNFSTSLASSSDRSTGGAQTIDMASSKGPGKPAPVFLHLLNKSTKYVVTGAAVGVLLWSQFDLATCWALIGAILNAFLCKMLKTILNHSRPITAGEKSDPGMPSSHAQSLGYLATYPAVLLFSHSPNMLLASLGLEAAAVFASWLRIACGLHTLDQVLVGYLAGASTALAWMWGGMQALPAISSSPNAVACVYGAHFILSGCFAFLVFDIKKVFRRIIGKAE